MPLGSLYCKTVLVTVSFGLLLSFLSMVMQKKHTLLHWNIVHADTITVTLELKCAYNNYLSLL